MGRYLILERQEGRERGGRGRFHSEFIFFHFLVARGVQGGKRAYISRSFGHYSGGWISFVVSSLEFGEYV
jgi:hypothetical protein